MGDWPGYWKGVEQVAGKGKSFFQIRIYSVATGTSGLSLPVCRDIVGFQIQDIGGLSSATMSTMFQRFPLYLDLEVGTEYPIPSLSSFSSCPQVLPEYLSCFV